MWQQAPTSLMPRSYADEVTPPLTVIAKNMSVEKGYGVQASVATMMPDDIKPDP